MASQNAKGCLVLCGIVLCLALIITGLSDSDPDRPRYSESSRSAQSVQSLTDSQRSMAITTIEGYSGVRDAAITQEGRQLVLVLVVDYATSETQCKQLGDNFVRLVKSVGPDSAPGKEIGRGQYDYRIGVFFPNEKRLAMGAKVRTSPRITW